MGSWGLSPSWYAGVIELRSQTGVNNIRNKTQNSTTKLENMPVKVMVWGRERTREPWWQDEDIAGGVSAGT